jgi:prepilin-type N-terminal cleavage/methylation domain-containing protein
MARISHSRGYQARGAFTLVEMLAVMVVVGLLMTLGLGMFRDKARARRVAADTVAGMVDQARNTAIRTRREVFLAIAGPGEIPQSGEGSVCRIGLFELSERPDENGAAKGRLLERWRPLPKGIVAAGGPVDGLRNVLDESGLRLSCEIGGEEVEATLKGIVFTPRGGMAWPKGSDPVAVRLVEGSYAGGAAVRTRRDGGEDEIIRVGRVVARPWRTGS